MTLEPNQPDPSDQPETEAAAEADGQPTATSEIAPPEPAAPVAGMPEPAAAAAVAPAAAASPAAAQVAAAPLAAAAAAPPPSAPPTAPPAWQPPAVPAGPFPGVRFADHGPRLISFILDHLIILGISLVILAAFLIVAGIFRPSAWTSWRRRR